MNADIRRLEDSIIDVLNQSDIPVEVKRLIILDVLNLVTKCADKTILDEINQANKEASNG